MDEKLQLLKTTKETVEAYLHQVQNGGRVDYDAMIPEVCNLLNDLYNNKIYNRQLDEATYYFTDDSLVDDHIKHLAEQGNTQQIKWYLQDVTDFWKYYYKEKDGSLMNITNDDLETWLTDINDELDYEIEQF